MAASTPPTADGGPGYPPLPARRRLPDARRTEVGRRLRHAYEQGASIRELCDASRYSIGRVRGLLAEAGTQLRGRGGPHPRTGTAPAETAPSDG